MSSKIGLAVERIFFDKHLRGDHWTWYKSESWPQGYRRSVLKRVFENLTFKFSPAYFCVVAKISKKEDLLIRYLVEVKGKSNITSKDVRHYWEMTNEEIYDRLSPRIIAYNLSRLEA